MQTTYRRLLEFLNAAALWQKDAPGQDGTKFAYAVRKVQKAGLKLFAEYEERQQDANIEHAATDKDGVLLREPNNNLRFTKDGQKKINAVIRAMINETVDVTPFMGSQPPKDLPMAICDAFQGFVLPEGDDDAPTD